MKVRTDELKGAALDWVAAKTGGRNDLADQILNRPLSYSFRPSAEWKHFGPIVAEMLKTGKAIQLEQTERIEDGQRFCASMNRPNHFSFGETELVALTRCYAYSVHGAEVDVPEELL